MKYLILFGIIYFAFRYFNSKKRIEKRESDFPTPRQKEVQDNDYGEYTDYEEID